MEGDLGIIDRQRLEVVPEEETADVQMETATPATANETDETADRPEGEQHTGAEVSNELDLQKTADGGEVEANAVTKENAFSMEKAAQDIEDFGKAGDAIKTSEANEKHDSQAQPTSELQLSGQTDDMPKDFLEKGIESSTRALSNTETSTALNRDGIEKHDKWTSPSFADNVDTSNVLSNEPKISLSEVFKTIFLKIQTQNNVINNLKEKIKMKSIKFPRTPCENNEIRNLNICIKEESKKLHCLLRQAMNLHKLNPDRKWPAIELATTYMEDCKPIEVNILRPVCGCEGNTYMDDKLSSANCSSLETSETSSYKSGSTADRFGKYFVNLNPEERKSYEHKPRDKDPLFLQLRPENRRAYSLDPKKRLKPRYVNYVKNSGLSDSVARKMSPNHIIKCIQQKVDNIKNELLMWERARPGSESPGKFHKSSQPKNSAHRCEHDFENMLSRLEDVLECDKIEKTSDFDESDTSEKSTDVCQQMRQTVCSCCSKKENPMSLKELDYRDLTGRYCELLEEYGRKEREVTKLNTIISGLTEGNQAKADGTSNNSTVEVRVLQKKLQQSQEDNEDYKVLICEQARQIDDYRMKYLAALQKIEEQKCILQKMEIDNRRVEDQINCEIQQIKDKFQQKLQEYSKLPALLENEQIKLAECSRQRDDLEMKLRIVCRELKSVKAAQNQIRTDTEDPERCKKLSNELSNLRRKYDLLKDSKDELSEKYDRRRHEFDVLRSESAKIICRMRERSKINQLTLQKHIDDLENDLAKCRATASLSMADREAVIKDMQAQLNCLALSFDSSQKQIKTLKDHIAYISGGKTNSIVICCEADKTR